MFGFSHLFMNFWQQSVERSRPTRLEFLRVRFSLEFHASACIGKGNADSIELDWNVSVS
jgi:hypothetical protein